MHTFIFSPSSLFSFPKLAAVLQVRFQDEAVHAAFATATTKTTAASSVTPAGGGGGGSGHAAKNKKDASSVVPQSPTSPPLPPFLVLPLNHGEEQQAQDEPAGSGDVSGNGGGGYGGTGVGASAHGDDVHALGGLFISPAGTNDASSPNGPNGSPNSSNGWSGALVIDDIEFPTLRVRALFLSIKDFFFSFFKSYCL